MKFVFLIDKPSSIVVTKDTGFSFMEEAFARKHQVYYLAKGNISLKNGEVYLKSCLTKVDRCKEKFLQLAPKQDLPAKNFDAIFIRLDPPFDKEYLIQTWLLDLAKDDCFIINNPSAVRSANEKLWATRFSSLMPRTLVTRNAADCYDFVKQEKKIIAKPLDGFGGKSVFLLESTDSNVKVILEMLSQSFSTEIMLQEYIPAATKGDKRIHLLNGEIIGAILRYNESNDHRNNFFTGGKPKATEITNRDREIVATIAPYLKQAGLYYTGIDVIGDYLIEVNVTSPTGIQETSLLAQQNLAEKVIMFVEDQVSKRK